VAEILVVGGGMTGDGSRLGSSYALVTGDRAYLLDCGEGCGLQMECHGLDPLSIRAVFITHMHHDHVAGLFGLLFRFWAYCRRQEDVPEAIRGFSSWRQLPASAIPDSLTVGVPEEAVDAVEAFLPTLYLAKELWHLALRIQPIRTGPFYKDDVLRALAFPTGHLSSQPLNRQLPEQYPWIQLQSFGFVIHVQGTRLVYSGDLALSGEAGVEEFRPHAEQADVIISEVAHVPPEHLVRMLARTDASRILLVHVHPKLRERLADVLDGYSDPRFVLAENGTRYPVA
jgi:ribonuclease BN (tRNA processing enzyme)